MGDKKGAGQRGSKIIWAFLFAAIASAISIAAANLNLFRVWEYKTYDIRMAATQGMRPKPRNVAMFYVDEPSLRHMSEQGINWPWPREIYAGALDFCRRGGAKAVVFDLFFSEDSVYGVGDDESFAGSLKSGPPSYLVLFLSKNETERDPRTETILSKSSIPISPPFPSWIDTESAFMSLPIPPLLDAASGFGNATLPPDEDGTYRRLKLLSTFEEAAIPSMPLKVVSDIKGIKGISWPIKLHLKFDKKIIPLDADGNMLIKYYGAADTFPNYPLAGILVADSQLAEGKTPDINPEVVRNKVVIIGVAAPGLYDLKPMPLARTYPGPEVHATIIENLLTSDFIKPAGQAPAIAMTFISALMVAFGLAFISSTWAMGLLIVAMLILPAALGVGLFAIGTSIPFIPPFCAIVLSAFSQTVRNYMTEGRKKRAIRRAFGQYLSPHVVAEISKDPDALKLGGEVRELTLFFSDIADFTTISEKTAPERLVAELNEYFSTTTKIIQEFEGTLDKYIGDAIMAFWGAPLATKDHAALAVLTAMRVQDVLKENSSLETRIGIHTGPAVVGNIGSDVRFNYTAIGDTVNLASRLEGLNKKFGTKIIISEATFKLAAHKIEARMIGRVRVKGRGEPVEIFEPLGQKGSFGKLGIKNAEAFGKAMDFYMQRKFADALSVFRALSTEAQDACSARYVEICDQYMKEAPKDFDGVTTFTTK